MSRITNQSSVDVSIALYLQCGLSELTVNDKVIAREIHQQYQNKLMCDDATIALEIQQQEGNLQTSLSDDENLARYLQQEDQCSLQPSISDDENLARYLQQEDECSNLQPFLSDDENLARNFQEADECNLQPSLSDDENLARSLQREDELNRSYILPQRDDPSSSRSFFHNEDGGNFSGHQIYGPPNISYNTSGDNFSGHRVYGRPEIPHYTSGENFSGHQIYSPPNISYNTSGDNFSGHQIYGPPEIPHYTSGEKFSGHQIYSPPNISHYTSSANEDMTYEGLTELGDSIGAVGGGLSKRRIAQLPTHKFGTKPPTTWSSLFKKKKKFVPDNSQCSICLEEYNMGDKITTLPCNHIYHKDCIANWLKRKKECCVCKAKIEP